MSNNVTSRQQFGEVPPEYGSTPIPEGAIRFNHYTSPEAGPAIMRDGLRKRFAEERYAKGGTESPEIFATAGAMDPSNLHRADYVEGYAHPEQLSIGNRRPGADPVEHVKRLEGNRSVLTARGDIPADQILAVHKQWHNHAKYIESDPDTLKSTLAGDNDFLDDDPHYGPAIAYIKQKHGR